MIFPHPELQIGFGLRLRAGARDFLQVSLFETVERLDVRQVDVDLARLAPAEGLNLMAAHGLRGELAFATPTVLRANPRLLGFYRLLLGYSQKDFYGKRIGAGGFKAMEMAGRITAKVEPDVEALAKGLCSAAGTLLTGLSGVGLSQAFLNDLGLLTLGAQFRGSRNNAIGAQGVREVIGVIQKLTSSSGSTLAEGVLTFKNSAMRQVLVEFGADPDVTIRVALHDDEIDKVLAIEIKAGEDVSNLYNRLGEAEKSHVTARLAGFTDFWTIVNTPRFDEAEAHRKSPSTNRFYRLADLLDEGSPAFADFRSRLLVKVGLPQT